MVYQMKITIITLFPTMFEGFLTESIVGKAQKNGKLDLAFVNLREFAKDHYGSVDDRPYGGGAGMIVRVDVIYECLKSILGEEMVKPNQIFNFQFPNSNLNNDNAKKLRASNGVRVVLTSAKGHTYSQAKAEKYAQLDHVVIIAGHYEGVDERIMNFIDEEISIGQYVLTGGELPAAVIADSIVRLIPGVLKKDDAAINESFSEVNISELEKLDITVPEKMNKKGTVRLKESAHYTRPDDFMGMKVPDVLKSGDHQAVRKWRLQQAVK